MAYKPLHIILQIESCVLKMKAEDEINCFEYKIIDNNVLYIIEGVTYPFTSTSVQVILLTGNSDIIFIS